MIYATSPVLLLLSCAWLAVVSLLIYRALDQRGLLPCVASAAAPSAREAPNVVAIVPVRDEEANIAACLRGLTTQTYPESRWQVLVVDDHSADATVPFVQSFAAAHPAVTLLRTPPLPPLWVGKSHACWIGALAAEDDAAWLCFLDADVHAEPALIASAVAAAESRQLDLLSLAPRQELVSFAERLVMPCGLYLLAFCRDLRKVQSRQGDDATATGQFMLVRRAVYDAVGGHAAIHTDICEDVALARAIKQAGGNVLMCDGRTLLSTRMYVGWRTLWLGVAKNLVDMLGGPGPTMLTAAVGVALAWAAWLIPAADAAVCLSGETVGCFALAPALAGSAAAIGLHLAGTVYFQIPLWYGLLFPFGYTAGALMAIDSVRRRWRGRVTWKGRTYP